MKEIYKLESHSYWNQQYREIDWKVVHNAGDKEKTEKLAELEIDLFLKPTKEKCESLLNDKEINPWPTFTQDFWSHPEVPTGGIALDYGCGSLARYSVALSKYFKNVFGVDISSEAIVRAKQNLSTKKISNVNVRVCDGMKLDFPSNFFDFVFSNLVLQHIGVKSVNYGLATEFARVLKPGGYGRLEYLDSSQNKGERFESVVEGNGLSAEELEPFFNKNNCAIIHATEGFPYLWITIKKKSA